MPPKKNAKKEIPDLRRKRNVPATINEPVNVEEALRNNKKRKNNFVTSVNKKTKVTAASEEVSLIHPAKHTASATASSANLVNENEKICEEKYAACLDTPISSEMSCIPLNYNAHKVSSPSTKLRSDKINNLSVSDVSEIKLSDAVRVKDAHKFQEEIQCIICMDTKRAFRYRWLECSHRFHCVCIQAWNKYNNVCPICVPYSYVSNNLDALTDEDIFETHEAVPCLICLDTVESSSFNNLSCLHSFHAECLQTWFEIKETCPVCMGCNISNLNQEDEFHDLREVMQCIICKNTEISSNFEFLSCGHNFHVICLQSWFQVNTSCPICVPCNSINNFPNQFQEKGRNGEQCVICMGTEETLDFQTLSCQHSFHVPCIQTWYQIKNTCPICMPTVNLRDNLNAFSNDYGELRCMICMDVETSLELDIISCDMSRNIWHAFHSKCIETWFQTNDSCPICIPDITLNDPSNILNEEHSENVICAICVDTENYSDIQFLACCHSFHTICIQNWLKVRKKCPMCNTVISVKVISRRR